MREWVPAVKRLRLNLAQKMGGIGGVSPESDNCFVSISFLNLDSALRKEACCLLHRWLVTEQTWAPCHLPTWCCVSCGSNAKLLLMLAQWGNKSSSVILELSPQIATHWTSHPTGDCCKVGRETSSNWYSLWAFFLFAAALFLWQIDQTITGHSANRRLWKQIEGAIPPFLA